MRRVMGVAMLTWACLGAGGCARGRHLSPDYGRSFHAAIERQAEHPEPATKRPIRGLDPQDAAIIARTYRRGLAARSSSGGELNAPIVIAPTPAPGMGPRETTETDR